MKTYKNHGPSKYVINEWKGNVSTTRPGRVTGTVGYSAGVAEAAMGILLVGTLERRWCKE